MANTKLRHTFGFLHIESPTPGATLMPPYIITGCTVANANVSIQVDNASPVRVQANEQGVFSFDYQNDLSSGKHILKVCAFNSWFNKKVCMIFCTPQRALPPPIIVTPTEGEIIADSTPTISGSARPGNMVTICLTGQGCLNTTANQEGLFSITFPNSLADGNYTVTATQTNACGCTSKCAVVNFSVATASLAFHLEQVSTGTTFRTIDAEIRLSGPPGTVTIYYLLLPPGAPAPTEQEIISYDDVAALTDGTSARGNFTLPLMPIPTTIIRALTGREVPSPLAQETGIVDGYFYSVYMLAIASDGTSSGVLSGGFPVMGMAFAGGMGTTSSPYQISQLSQTQLDEYPDLLAGHPLNLASVDQTARLLDNIERLQVLYDQTDGVYGLLNSLSLSYELTSPMDLSNYIGAYGGRGWIPIGNYDSSRFDVGLSGRHIFTGTFDGGANNISNLTMTPSSENFWVANIGLFGRAENASISAMSLTNVFIQAQGSPSSDVLEAVSIASLIGSAANCRVYEISAGNVNILGILETTDANRMHIGGLIGTASEDFTLEDISLFNISLTDVNRNASYMGGVVAVLDQLSGNATLLRIDCQNEILNGYFRVGGIIGSAPNGIASVSQCTLSTVNILASGNTCGGFVAYLNTQTSSVIDTVTVQSVFINQPEGSSTSNAGGMFGFVSNGDNLEIINCRVITGEIYGAGFMGGFMGTLQCQNVGITVISCSASGMNVSGTSNSVGGFLGIYSSANDAQSRFVECRCINSAQILGRTFVGGFVGQSNLLSGSPIVTYDTCDTDAIVTSTQASSQAGGFVGDTNNSFYLHCRAAGDVSGNTYLGGFSGLANGSALSSNTEHRVKFVLCAATGNVASSTVVSNAEVGGFAGSSRNAHIDRCLSTGSVSVNTGVNVGGITGSINGFSILENSYSTSVIQAQDSLMVGGVCGNITSTVLILKCYSSGSISARGNVGGIAGRIGAAGDELGYCLALESTLSATLSPVNRVIGTYTSGTIYPNAAIDTLVKTINGVPQPPISNATGLDGLTITQAQIISTIISYGWDTSTIWDTSTVASLGRPTLFENAE